MKGIHEEPQRVRSLDYSGGINDRNKSWVIAENETPFIQNMDIQSPGAAERRDGAASIGAASGQTNVNLPYGAFKFYDRSTFNNEIIYTVNGGHLYMLSGNSQVLEKGCGISLTGSLHMGSRGLWRATDSLYISNAQLNESNQSLASRLVVIDIDQNFSVAQSMAPLCTTWWQGRLWVGGNRLTEDNETLWWSSLNDGLAFSVTNTVRVEPGRGGRITGLVPPRAASPRLIVFKEEMIAMFEVYWGSSSSQIPGPADALDTILSNIRVVAENVGCIASKSIQYVPGAPAGDIFFLSKDGIRAISRAQDDTVSGSSLPISSKCRDQVARINFAHAHKAVSGVWDQKYHIGVPMDGATENTHVLSFDLITGAWYLNTWDPKDFVTARLNQTRDRLLFQNNQFTSDSVSSGLVSGWHTYRAFSGDIDPGNIPVEYMLDTRSYGFGTLEQKKRWSWFGVQAENANATCVMDVFYKIDDGDWVFKEAVTFPVAGGNIITLGVTPLPWQPSGVAINIRKIGLEDLPPGYLIQFRLTQTSVSDFGQPAILMTAAAARMIDTEWDNDIT